ncbi:MAG: hypothetical protein FJX04_05635 [Alphaproteobacteria bacterium]|nr:hypothetical protein [Alphaproteobacteria bacterium]
MGALQIDFTRPMTFQNAMQNFALSLAFVMVALRDEAAFREEPDDAILIAAHLLCPMLEDSHREAVVLTKTIDQRLLTSTN